LTNHRQETDFLSANSKTLLDLNHILLFIAIASPVVLLARLVALRESRPPGWVAASVIVLFGAAGCWLLRPAIAGYLGGALWALLLLAPSLLERCIASLLLEKRYARARSLSFVRRVLHPWNRSADFSSLLRALELARSGKLPAALDRLATLRLSSTAAGSRAIAYTYALTGNWSGLAEWCRHDLAVTNDAAVRALYLRALGETGALDDLAWKVAGRQDAGELRLTNSARTAQEQLWLFAFAGRTEAVVRLNRGALARTPIADQEFWIATAELAEGKGAAAVARLSELRGKTGDAVLERAIGSRLADGETLAASRLSPSSERLLARLLASESDISSPRNRRGAPAVWALILLNLAMFAVEIFLGGATNTQTLHLLGALEPRAVIVRHEYWRLFTALFLHYGLLHIAVNLYALYLLGPALERMIGGMKFLAGYLLAGLGSSAGVVGLSALGLTNADQLVGASGCVMGLIGISAGFLLRHRQSPLVGRRLRGILGIVVFQTLFDLWTPQVSLGAHLSGFVSGVCIGIIFAQWKSSPQVSS
jgi:rhomboid protease GluP